MDAKTKELVGIAASIAGHCQKCFNYHYTAAKKIGVDDLDIKESIDFARSIRKAGDNGMDEFAELLVSQKKSDQ